MVTDIPPNFRSQILSITSGLIIIGFGLAVYLPLSLICLRFICFDGHARTKSSHRILTFVVLSFTMTITNLIVGCVNDIDFFLCALDSDTPVQLCNNTTADEEVLRRHALVTACRVIVYILADGMLFYRAVVIWQREWKIFTLVGILWLGQEAFQIYSQVISFDPKSSLFVVAASYWASALWDVLTSSLIIFKLLRYRSNAKVTERKQSIATYTSLAAVFFEGSLLFSSTRMLYAGLILTRKPFMYSYWSATLVDISAAISPLFIILRLALNSFVDPYARDRDRTVPLSSFRVASGSALRTIIMGNRASNVPPLDPIPQSQLSQNSAYSSPIYSQAERGPYSPTEKRAGVHIASLN